MEWNISYVKAIYIGLDQPDIKLLWSRSDRYPSDAYYDIHPTPLASDGHQSDVGHSIFAV